MNAETTSTAPFVIPQHTFASAPALEVRELGGGKEITQKQALAEIAELGEGWRLETPHEFFALRSPLIHENGNGAHCYDETIKQGWYWTSEETPWYEGGRVVVGFSGGYVSSNLGNSLRAFARAVRVSGQ